MMSILNIKSIILIENQRGIALIQVLLITAILSVLAMYLTQTARDQLKVAHWLDDKATAIVALHDAESELMFTLLTKPFLAESLNESEYSQESNDSVSIHDKWNFYGAPFPLNNQTTISIQDQAGLINIHYPNHNIFKRLVSAAVRSNIGAEQVLNALLDWQDTDQDTRINGSESGIIRNGTLTSIMELNHIPNIPEAILPLLYDNVTIYGKRNFNPMNASKELIAALSNDIIAEEIHSSRINNTLTREYFIDMVPLEGDGDIYLYPSNYLAITIRVNVGESKAKKEIILSVSPNAAGINSSPINIYSNRN